MGKSIPIPSTQKLQQFTRVINSKNTNTNKLHRPAQLRPVSKSPPISPPITDPLRIKARKMDSAAAERLPLAEVVAACVKRWFQDTLKEAKNGDTSMQVLVGQMYYSGYGVVRDPHKGRAWINRASKIRSSVWKVGDKRPGYNASDSDSDEVKEDSK
ncbi:hypothetical protein ACJIZ3_009524 [Penstemon smallii]|uniref:Uncharacterized protein n=1 Tax=Penstemon smallii TaxID=265156 RepID=A0ABD3TE04_9LAMI